jgi:creatinine amidohydrolase
VEEYRLGKLTWPELEEAKGKIVAVLVPVGSTEQHGPHLPFDTDAFTSVVFAERVAAECQADGLRVLVTPAINFGVSWYHMDFAGTMSISVSLYISMVKDLMHCLIKHKFRNIILLNSHGGNSAALTVAINDIYNETKERIYLANWASVANDRVQSLGIRSPMIHTEEIETSVAIALGQRFRPEKAVKDCFSRKDVYERKGLATSSHVYYDALNPGHGVLIPMDFIRDISPSGVVGDATLGNEAEGEDITKIVVRRLKEMIADLSKSGIKRNNKKGRVKK